MSRPFNIVGYDLQLDLFECRCAVCSKSYFISNNLLPQDKLGLCNDCEKEVYLLEDMLRR